MKNIDEKPLDEFEVAILCCVPVTTVREWRRWESDLVFGKPPGTRPRISVFT